MTVLVTGGAGYIGSHMVWELLDHGEDVVVIDRLSTGFDWAVPPEARLVVGDIGDAALLDTVFRRHSIDAVIHFAGSVVVPESIADPLGYYENNTCKSRLLVERSLAADVKHFIFSSTAAIYGVTGDDLVAEDRRPVPITPYGASKLMTEQMLADTSAAHDFRFVALRYFNVSGADPRGRTGQSTPGATHLLKVACETALGKRPRMEVFGTDYPTRDGTCERDFIHVSDLVAAHWSALSYLRAGGEPLIANCGYGRGFSVLELIDSVRRMSGRDFEVHMAPRREGDLSRVIADASLARRVLDWKPRHDDLDHIVATALSWEEALSKRNTTSMLQTPEPGLFDLRPERIAATARRR
jgi:UDP-glucose 4-epimerase